MRQPAARRLDTLFEVTEKQFAAMKLLLGELKTQEKKVNSDQLLLF